MVNLRIQSEYRKIRTRNNFEFGHFSRSDSNAYILVKETMTVENKAAEDAANNVTIKMVIFKHCAPSTNSISRINNVKGNDAHDIDMVMAMYNLIEYNDNYSKMSGILWQL